MAEEKHEESLSEDIEWSDNGFSSKTRKLFNEVKSIFSNNHTLIGISMARSAAAKLCFLLSRNTKLDVSSRRFISRVCGSYWGLANGEFKSSYWSTWQPTRSFHGTSHMCARDYYDVLGVSKDASASEIKKAYYAGYKIIGSHSGVKLCSHVRGLSRN